MFAHLLINPLIYSLIDINFLAIARLRYASSRHYVDNDQMFSQRAIEEIIDLFIAIVVSSYNRNFAENQRRSVFLVLQLGACVNSREKKEN